MEEKQAADVGVIRFCKCALYAFRSAPYALNRIISDRYKHKRAFLFIDEQN